MARLVSGPGEIDSNPDGFRQPTSRRARLFFPVAVTLLAAAAAPPAASLVGSLMAGNLLREAGHDTRLARFWQGPGAAIAAVLFGLAAGGALDGQRVALADLAIAAVVGLPTLVLATAFGIFATKMINAALKNRLPLLAGTHSLAVFPCSRRDFSDVYGAGQIVSALLGSVLVNFLLL
jgi:oxaloacetate decarboxylase beta subunit